MVPVTPSPRRGTFKSLRDLQRKNGPDSNGLSLPAGDDGGPPGIPLPPLYYKKPEVETLGMESSSASLSATAQDFVYKTPEKSRASRPSLQTTRGTLKNCFMPIDRPPLSRSSATPPISPLVGKQSFVPGTASPGFSVGSVAPTEAMTEGTLTPTPSTSYLQIANTSPYASSSQQYRQTPASPVLPRTVGGRSPSIGGNSAFGPPLSPRKSPNKYYQNRRNSGSPMPHSSYHGAVSPYSPGASSIGSHSTTATAVDDTVRRQRVKTELCTHFMSGRGCPFGLNCTFAHGEEELQKTKLMDLQRAGLIDDVETYRTKPCLTWVATGSCPFGKRCQFIHDPRAMGQESSWLPHTETQGNSMSTDINVDALHQKRLGAILYDNPFGEQFAMEMDEFADLYKLICNTTNSNKRRKNNLSELHKIAIALQMRDNHNWMYKYLPQHMIYEELCMVLQKRAFRLEKSGKVTPIQIAAFNPKNSQHVMVREIAFGPDADTTVRGVALWFNIPEHEVAECHPQLSKRYRWKKAPKFDDQRALEKKPSVFDSRECFVMVRPSDHDAFDLATDILRHRHKTVTAERLSNLRERFEALNDLQKEKDALQDTFLNHKRSWTSWAWPINTGRQSVDHDTPVPPVDGRYTPLLDLEAMEKAILAGQDDETEAVKGSASVSVWESFVSLNLGQNEAAQQEPICKRRLSIFERLSNGEAICPNRTLPHITRSTPSHLSGQRKGKPTKSVPGVPSRQSELCWRALMQKSGSNEWDMVRDHFQNARCKKVLTILQN